MRAKSLEANTQPYNNILHWVYPLSSGPAVQVKWASVEQWSTDHKSSKAPIIRTSTKKQRSKQQPKNRINYEPENQVVEFKGKLLHALLAGVEHYSRFIRVIEAAEHVAATARRRAAVPCKVLFWTCCRTHIWISMTARNWMQVILL